MTFWSTMLAFMVGIGLWDIVTITIRFGWKKWKDRMENKTRKIGFGSEEGSGKSGDGPKMRRIGFGEND